MMRKYLVPRGEETRMDILEGSGDSSICTDHSGSRNQIRCSWLIWRIGAMMWSSYSGLSDGHKILTVEVEWGRGQITDLRFRSPWAVRCRTGSKKTLA